MPLDYARFNSVITELNQELTQSSQPKTTSSAEAPRNRIPTLLEKLSSFSEDEVKRLIDSVRESLSGKTTEDQKEICQKTLIDIAKCLAAKDPSALAVNIDKYLHNSSTKEGQKTLIEIAKIAAQQSASWTSYYIQKYGIDGSTAEGQRALIDIAKIAAEKDGRAISEWITKFNIRQDTEEGQRALIEIAKIAAQNHGTSRFIQNYSIKAYTEEGQKALIEIAKIAAEKDGGGTSEFIQNYGINTSTKEGLKAQIDIAKIAAKQNGQGTSHYIHKYDIKASTKEGLKALIEIAKVAAEKDGGGTSEFIQNYGINASTEEGRKALIDIAKIAAQQDGQGTSHYMHKYGINASTKEGQQALIEIAKTAAQQNGHGTSQSIQLYGINASTQEGQQALIDIAKIAAQQNGGGVSGYIRNYGINASNPAGQQALIEIAKIAAKQDGEGTSRYITYYGINASTREGQQALIEIAKIAAKQNGPGTSFHIQNYGIKASTQEGQQALIEIAKIAAKKDRLTWQYIKYYHIKPDTPEAQSAFVEIWISTQGGNAQKAFLNFGCKWARHDFEKNVKKIIREIFEKIWFNKSNFLQQLDALLNEVIDAQKLKSPIFLSVLNFLISKNESLDLCSTLKIVKEAFSIKDPALCTMILSDLIKFDSIQQGLGKLMQENSALVYVLPNFYLAILEEQGVDCKNVIADLKNMKPWLKDVFFTKQLLKMLHSLAMMQSLKGDGLDSHDKQAILENTMCIPKELSKTTGLKKEEVKEVQEWEKQKQSELKKKIKSAFQAVQGVIALEAPNLLKGIQDIDGCSQALEKAFRAALPALNAIPHFGERFSETFGRFRDSRAVYIYTSDMQRLEPEESELMLKSLAGCIEDVLNERFPACRYSDSLHLETVFKGRPTLKEDWKKGAQKPLAEMTRRAHQAEKRGAIDFGKLLLGSFEEGHVASATYPELYQCLKNPEILSKIGEEIKQKLQDPELEKEDKRKLLFEQSLIHLAGNPDNPEKDLQRAIELLPTKSQKGYSSQFDADIRGLLKSLEEKKTLEEKSLSSAKWTIVDTDDLCDLFLCGTEVEGSCQRIGGEPGFNKCLLAYVMDGKNRLLAIKDEKGQIKARAILRILLNDHNEPILFMESIYPDLIATELENALLEMARERSLALRIPLALAGGGEGKNSPGALHSLSGKGFEYVDAGDGVTNGVFKLYNSQYMDGAVGIEGNSL